MSTEPGIRKSTISAVVVMFTTLLSRILGFLRTAVISAFFGASGTADVINLTFAVPNNLRKLMAEGALSSAFIPVLSETIESDSGSGGKNTQKIIGNIISFQLLIIIPLCLLSIIFAEPLIKHVLTQFRDPDQIALAISLFRFFIVYLLFISVSAVLMGLLNCLNFFFIPAVTPVLFSISVISSIIIFHRTLGVYSMAAGVLVGGVAQILFQLPLTKKLGYSVKPDLRFNNLYFKKILKQWFPVLATSSVFTVNQQVAFLLASGLEEGSTSALVNALVFWQLPFGIFSASITTVLFPKMSRQALKDDIDGLRNTLNYGIRLLFSLLIPSAFFYIFFGRIVITTALQRGLFTLDNSIMTANVLRAYSLGLFSLGGFNFLQRFFYSRTKYNIPFYTALFVCALDIGLSLILRETPLRVNGLALANSIAFTAGFFILLFLSREIVFRLNGKIIINSFLKVLFSMIPSSVISFLLTSHFQGVWLTWSNFENLFFLILVFIIWIAVTLGMYRLTNLEIIDFLRKRSRN